MNDADKPDSARPPDLSLITQVQEKRLQSPRKRQRVEEDDDDEPVASSSLQSPAIYEEAEDEEVGGDDEEPVDEYYGAFPTKIAVRSSPGRVEAGEAVSLEREPTNSFDGNAIRVLNRLGRRVGYIPPNGEHHLPRTS